jgi:hypothetical protein
MTNPTPPGVVNPTISHRLKLSEALAKLSLSAGNGKFLPSYGMRTRFGGQEIAIIRGGQGLGGKLSPHHGLGLHQTDL